MLGTDYELVEAPESGCDHKLLPRNFSEDSNPEEQTYRCWEVEDETFLLAVEDTTPSLAIEAAENEGWQTTTTSEVNSERVKRIEASVREQTAYYVEEPPEERYESVGRRRALDLLDKRGRREDVASLDDAWWYPERKEFVAIYSSIDDAGETSRIVWRSTQLSASERALVLDGDPIDGDDKDHPSRREIAEVIDKNSPIYPREAEIASCWVEGIEDYQQIVRELGEDEVSYQSVTNSIYNFRDRQKAVAFSVLHVWPHVPDAHLPDPCQTILEQIDTEDIYNPVFGAPGKGRGKK